MVMEVPGKRRRGRPNRRWLDNIRNDLSEREFSGDEAPDRDKWRRLTRTSTPHKCGKGCGRRSVERQKEACETEKGPLQNSDRPTFLYGAEPCAAMKRQ